MVKRKRRSSISKAIRNLCSSTLLESVNRPEFKAGLKKIIDECQPALGNVGKVIKSWTIEYRNDIKDEIWQLVDEVEPKMREQYEKWAKSYKREG